MKWTEQDIATFWAMKDNGATLPQIAKALKRNVKSVQNLSYNQNKKMKEIKKMSNATETTEVTEAPKVDAPIPQPPQPTLDITVQQALAMIRSQGLAFDCMHMSLSDGGATLELHFARRQS